MGRRTAIDQAKSSKNWMQRKDHRNRRFWEWPTISVTQILIRLQFVRHKCECVYETITFKYTNNLQLYIYSTFPNINIVFFLFQHSHRRSHRKLEKWAAHVAQYYFFYYYYYFITKRPSGCAFAINSEPCSLAQPCAQTIFDAPFQFASRIDDDLHGFSIFIFGHYSFTCTDPIAASSVCSINHSWKK